MGGLERCGKYEGSLLLELVPVLDKTVSLLGARRESEIQSRSMSMSTFGER